MRQAMMCVSTVFFAAEQEPVRSSLGVLLCRPTVASGAGGWGQKATLSLDHIRQLAADA